MENIGLKSYAKNLEVSLPLGQAYVNLCSRQNNVILNIPLVEEMGISFLFNYLKRNEKGSMGKGGHISLFRKVQYNRVYNPDFTSDNYVLNEQNNETGLTLSKVEYPPSGQGPTYELKDKDGNVIKYVNPHFNYPTEIINANNERDTYAYNGNTITFTSKNDIIKMYLKSDGCIEKLEHIHCNTLVKTAYIYYQNDYVSTIVFELGRGGSMSYEIIRENDYLEVRDPMTKTGRKFTFDNNGKLRWTTMLTYTSNQNSNTLSLLRERRDFSLSFDETSNITTVIDGDNRYEYYFFEKRDIKGQYYNSLYADDNGVVSTSEIDRNLNSLYEVGYDKALINKAIFNNFSLDDFSTGDSRNYQPTDIESLIISDTARILETSESYHDWPVNANGGDVYTLTCIAKSLSGEKQLTIQLGDEGNVVDIFDNWKLICVTAKIEKHTETLRLRFETTGEVVIGAINLFKNSFANFYNYEKNESNSTNGSGLISQSGGAISNIVDSNGSRYMLEYDDDKNLTSFKKSNGVEVKNTYDGAHHVIQQDIIGKELTITTRNRYDEFGRLSEVDEGNSYAKTFYGYDEFGTLTSVAKATLVNRRVIDAYGELGQLIIRPFNSGVTPQTEVTFHRNEQNPKLIESIEINNGTTYSFGYDLFGRIEKLFLNNECVFRYQYDGDSDRIKRQYFGNNSDYFEFTYRTDGNIIRTTYSSGDLYYEYSYDGCDRIEKIFEHRDGETKLLEHYHYDDKNMLAKTTNELKSISKIFDNNHKETRNKSSFDGKEIIHEYDSVERAMGSNPEMIFDELKQHDGYSVASFIGGNNCVGGDVTYTCHFRKKKNNANYLVTSNDEYYQLYRDEPEYDKNIPCVNSSNRIAFVAKGQPQGLTAQSVAFWFKSSTHKTNACLFYTKSRSGGCSLALYERYIIGRHCLDVVIEDRSKNSDVVLTTLSHDINPNETHFALNEWNFVALTCAIEMRNGYRAMIIKLNLNGLKFEKVLNQIDFQWDLQDSNLEMNIGYVYLHNVQTQGEEENRIVNSFDNAKFALIAIGNRRAIDDEILDAYYRRTKSYIDDNVLTGDYNVFDCSIARLVKTKNDDFGTFKVFPLENNPFSLDYDPVDTNPEDVPFKFDLRKGYANDKDSTFDFDKTLKKYVLVLDGNRLSYKTQFSGSGTVAASFFFDDVFGKQYIFDIRSNSSRISLFKDGESDQTCVVIDINGVKTTKWLSWYPSDNRWHDIALSFDKRVQTGYFGSTYSCYLRIICDKTRVFEQEIGNISMQNDVEILLGRSFYAEQSSPSYDTGNIKHCSLFGKISNFAYNKAYNSEATIENLFNKLSQSISKIKFYNDMGFETKEEIAKGNESILAIEREWDRSLRNETFTNGSSSQTRSYSYDNLGNVQRIDASDESYNYIYDYQSFLLNEEYYGPKGSFYRNYLYDSNGNMTSRTGSNVNDTFYYVGDKLMSVNGESISYSVANPGNIEWFGNWSYEYEGRRLKKATFTVYKGQFIINRKEVVFDYNEKGLRTSKVMINTREMTNPSTGQKTISELSRKTYKYEYDGEDLAYEKSDDNEIFYLYDEDKKLYGYILNGNRYFYIKDALNNYLGVVDDSGTVVAKYVYDAFGTLIFSEGKIYNPIRYKGYYYDSEIEMFYCKSRYYVPKLCRWLNMDNPSFLREDDASKLNLFAFCYNNPVMSIDPDGTNWWTSFWNSTAGKIVGTVLVVAAAVALTVVTWGAGAAVTAALGGGFLAAVAGGAVGGAISGAIFGASISMISQGCEKGYANIDFGKVVVDTLLGAVSGAVTGAAFAALGRGIGLLGKTSWAQRPLSNWSNTSRNFMFGSKSGNFTFLRFGKTFRLEASIQHGLHYHAIAAGTTKEQWKFIFNLTKVIAGLIGGFVGKLEGDAIFKL